MNVDLSGRTAVISGSTAGIGYAIAEGLARAGASVLINGRSQERVREAVVRLQADVPNASVDGIAADLGTAVGAERITAYWQEADILVNNVGQYGPQPFFEITDADWEQYIQVNVLAAVRLSRHYARGMAERGWGRVLFNAAATSGFMSGEMVHFGATKAALLAVARGLAESLAGTGVTSNAFLPGPTRTESVSAYLGDLARSSGKPQAEVEGEMFTTALPTSLIRRFVNPTEIADLVTFLASDRAAAITGAALRVDGGIHRTML